MKILVVELRGIGDFVISNPVIVSLRRAFPDSLIVVAVRKAVEELARLCPCIDEVEVYDYKGEHKGLSGWLDIISRLRKYRFDLGVAPNFSFRSGLLLYLAGCKERVASPTDGRGIFLTKRSEYIPPGCRTGDCSLYAFSSLTEIRLKVLEPLGVKKEKYPCFDVPESIREKVYDRFLKDLTPPFFSIGATGSRLEKRWSLRKWRILIEELNEKYGASFLLFGTSDDRPYLSSLSFPFTFNTAGQTSISDLAGLLSFVDLHIGIDSSHMHIASALGVRCVGLYGSSSPFAWSPMAPQGLVRSIYKFLSCSPCCGKYPCYSFKPYGVRPCMSSISVEDVLREVREHMRAIRADEIKRNE